MLWQNSLSMKLLSAIIDTLADAHPHTPIVAMNNLAKLLEQPQNKALFQPFHSQLFDALAARLADAKVMAAFTQATLST
jgi:hypothetical protein